MSKFKKIKVKSITCVVLLSLIACGEEINESSTPDEVVKSEDVIDTDTTDYYIPDNPVVREYSIDELPKDWILLEEDSDGTLYILDHWESQEQGIHFAETDNGEWYLSVYHAQDSDDGLITNFIAEIEEGEGISIVDGSFTYHSSFDGEKVIKFEWNQMSYHAVFSGIGLGSETFASETEKRMYEVVVVDREEDE